MNRPHSIKPKAWRVTRSSPSHRTVRETIVIEGLHPHRNGFVTLGPDQSLQMHSPRASLRENVWGGEALNRTWAETSGRKGPDGLMEMRQSLIPQYKGKHGPTSSFEGGSG